MEQLIGLIFIAVLATFAGAELIGKIPPQLHTPLMSGSNACLLYTSPSPRDS